MIRELYFSKDKFVQAERLGIKQYDYETGLKNSS